MFFSDVMQQIGNNPKASLPGGLGTIMSVTPAPKVTLNTIGCSTKDALGVMKPTMTITKLMPAKRTDYTWAMTHTIAPGLDEPLVLQLGG